MVPRPRSLVVATPESEKKRSVQFQRNEIPPLKPLTTRVPSETTGTTEISNSSSSLSCSSNTSIYIKEVPLGVISPSNAKLYLPCESPSTKLQSKEEQAAELGRKHVEFWNRCVLSRSVSLGSRHLRTAEAMMELGNAQLAAEEYVSAGRTYLSALKIYQALYGDRHLAVARALDKVGLAASMSHANLDLALAALTDGLKIRCELLGPDHIDSVTSLNNVAGVRLNRREWAAAVQNYKTVLRYREQIFGRNHAGVAVTAYTLACVLEDRLGMHQEAYAHFQLAKSVYESLSMTKSTYYVDSSSRVQKYETILEI